MTFSVATWLRGGNSTPCTVREESEAVAGVYASVSHLVEWEVPVVGLDLVRCDVARDFSGVSDALTLLDALSYVRPINATTHLYRDKHCTGTETLSRKTSDW